MCIIKLLARLIAKKADISTALLANKTIRELQREVIMGKFIELTGQRFGRLVVIGRSRETRTQGVYWDCICDCGTKKVIIGSSLRGGVTKSCGCIVVENCTAHGLNKLPEASIYRGMKRRCLNPSSHGFKYYGGRGIKICDRWLGPEGLKHFILDMGPRPVGYEIDRINNNGDYEPENCRWVTPSENGRNKRNNASIIYNGETRCITEWAEILGMNHNTLFNRLNTLGWSPEKAFTTPEKEFLLDVTWNGVTKPITEWEKELGLNLYERILFH